MADLWDILYKDVEVFANQIFALANNEKGKSRYRCAVRKALEDRYLEIDKIWFPKQQVLLRNLDHIEKILQTLEENEEGEITRKTFIDGVVEAAKLNIKYFDEDELRKVAEKIFGDHEKLSRDRLRKFMDVHDYELADVS